MVWKDSAVTRGGAVRTMLVAVSAAVVLVAGLLAWSQRASAETEEMLLLDGNGWQQFSYEGKLAFVWGVAHVIEFERNLAGESWDADAKSFVPHLVAGLKGKTLNDVVVEVDAYYQASPNRLGDPVMKAIVHSIVLPVL
jgi:hypothetical protein